MLAEIVLTITGEIVFGMLEMVFSGWWESPPPFRRRKRDPAG